MTREEYIKLFGVCPIRMVDHYGHSFSDMEILSINKPPVLRDYESNWSVAHSMILTHDKWFTEEELLELLDRGVPENITHIQVEHFQKEYFNDSGEHIIYYPDIYSEKLLRTKNSLSSPLAAMLCHKPYVYDNIELMKLSMTKGIYSFPIIFECIVRGVEFHDQEYLSIRNGCEDVPDNTTVAHEIAKKLPPLYVYENGMKHEKSLFSQKQVDSLYQDDVIVLEDSYGRSVKDMLVQNGYPVND